MIEKTHPLPRSARRLLWVTRGVCAFSLIVLLGVVVVTYGLIFVNGTTIDQLVSKELFPAGVVKTLSLGQRLSMVTLLNSAMITGYIGLWLSFVLFGAYLRGNIFTMKSAARLRIIGWMVLLIPIVNTITQNLVVYLANLWFPTVRVPFEVTLEDSDLFAIAFGLLIVVVGHVMYQAIAISEENDSFV
ncbi:MAG: DUF2975 domain-containing protein [Rhizobiaceae bacterium]